MKTEDILSIEESAENLQPARQGFAFLGAYIYPGKAVAGRRAVKNFRECLFRPDCDLEKQSHRVQSYLGLLSHFGG